MFKHLVLWKFSPVIPKADYPALAEELSKTFGAMVGKIDGLLKAEIGLNLAADGEYNLILYTEFSSREAEQGYQIHPLHLAVKEKMKERVSGRAVMDYLA